MNQGGRNIIAGNWKMNLLSAAACDLAAGVVKSSSTLKKTEAWIAPPFLSIPAVSQAIRGSTVKLGSQNVHWEQSGAFTGDVSVSMLQEFGVTFAIVGHSERRHVFGESDTLIAKRTATALTSGWTVVLCIGETLDERKSGRTAAVLGTQLKAVYPALRDKEFSLVIAYEPVWAIGTGQVATLEQIEETHTMVQKDWNGNLSVPCPPILYGGSVTPDNFKDIISIPLVAGALVGGASLSTQKFGALLEISENS